MSETRRAPQDDDLRFDRRNAAAGAAALAVIALGYVLLAQGSVTLAPVLLILGYVVLVPLALLL
ncbi:MAG: hypothetical protein D6701_09130 [Gemmatimonadetes bacterium]|nr:MAG: hypothetical protein D6701_09130 [Gemmatimonadota bacterium]